MSAQNIQFYCNKLTEHVNAKYKPLDNKHIHVPTNIGTRYIVFFQKISIPLPRGMEFLGIQLGPILLKLLLFTMTFHWVGNKN